MIGATVFSNPTIDYVYINDKKKIKTGGPGYYYALYSKMLGSKVLIIGQSAPKDYHQIKKAHEYLGAELSLRIGDCTQKFLLLYSSELPSKRIAYPVTRCPLVYNHSASDIYIWSPTIIASINDILLLSYLLKHDIPVAIDFQGIARSSDYLHMYLNTVKNYNVSYAHMDMEEYVKICSILGITDNEKCLKILQVKEAIVSNGSEAGFYYCDEKIRKAIPPYKVHGEESTGAGDVLLFSYVISRLKGKSCDDAIKSSLELATTHVNLINMFSMDELLMKIKKSISLKALFD